MTEIRSQPVYYVEFFTTKYKSMEEVKTRAPEALAAHIARSNGLHKEGKLLMAGAFRNNPGESVSTMGVFLTREDAEEYAKGDPFGGMISEWHVREWNNILKD